MKGRQQARQQGAQRHVQRVRVLHRRQFARVEAEGGQAMAHGVAAAGELDLQLLAGRAELGRQVLVLQVQTAPVDAGSEGRARSQACVEATRGEAQIQHLLAERRLGGVGSFGVRVCVGHDVLRVVVLQGKVLVLQQG